MNMESTLEAHTDGEGMRAYVHEGSRTMEVQNISAISEDAAQRTGKSFADSLLNTLAYVYGEPLEVLSSAWRIRSDDQLVNNTYVVPEPVVIRMSPKKGAVKPTESDAAAYYRQGALARGTFDAFRNFYLVAETVTDQIVEEENERARGESERFKMALKVCFPTPPSRLIQIAQTIQGCVIGSDPFSNISNLLYSAHRCQLNHGKAGQPKKVPFDSDDERAVKEVLPLMRFVAKTFLHYEQGYQ